MTCLIEEGDDVPQQLLDTVLEGLASDNATAARSVAGGEATVAHGSCMHLLVLALPSIPGQLQNGYAAVKYSRMQSDPGVYACRLAERLLHRTEETLRPHLQKYLVEMITGQQVDTDLKIPHHIVIYKVHSWHSKQ